MKEANVVPVRSIIIVELSAIVIYSMIAYLSWLAAPSSQIEENVIVVRFLEILSLWIFSGILTVFIEWYRLSGKKIKWLLCAILPLLYIASVGAAVTTTFLIRLAKIDLSRPEISTVYFRFALYYIVPIIFAIIAYSFVAYLYIARHEKEKTQHAQFLLQQARWQMLRYQVNPHFLFNALNTIRSMLNKDQEKARKVITEMADYFRFSLSENPGGLIELEKELAAIKNYLEIQRLRYENKLDYEIVFESGIENTLIPLFSIQTLVENAVKYGMKTSGMPLKIWLEGKENKGFLSFRVINTGKIYTNFESGNNDNPEGTETGLKNLKGRLDVLYGGKAAFSLREDDGKVMATLFIPLKIYNEKMESNNSGR